MFGGEIVKIFGSNRIQDKVQDKVALGKFGPIIFLFQKA